MALLSLIAVVPALTQSTVTTNGGTTNSVPKFTGSTTIGDSAITETSGKVGIGTTNPGVRLHIANAGQAQFDLQDTITGGTPTNGSRWRLWADNVGGGGGNLTFGFYDVTNGRLPLGIDNNGNVGIGSTTPDSLLDVPVTSAQWARFGNGPHSLRIGTQQTGSPFISMGVKKTGLDNNYIASTGNNPAVNHSVIELGYEGSFRFKQQAHQSDGTILNPTENFTILPSGYVGIGAASPGYTLDVNGYIRARGAFVFPDGTTQSTAASGGGDITAVLAGDGLSGGAYSGDATLSVNSTVARTDRNQTFQGVQTFITTATAFGATFYNNNGGDVIRATCYNFNWNNGYCMKLDANATLHIANGTTNLPDFAESVTVSGDRKSYGPGDVIVIDTTGHQRFKISDKPYSTLVAGVYSTKPGFIGTSHPMADLDGHEFEREIPVAIVGIVPCKVTDENGPILPGDLLVTSSTSGFAMKGTDPTRLVGAVLGKALEPLERGNGAINVLVSLQ